MMRAQTRFQPRALRSDRRRRARLAKRQLSIQPLESRCLLASIGDWAYIDLSSVITDGASPFKDLTGVAFYGNQLAVVGNSASGATEAGHLVLLNYDLETNTASVASSQLIPTLGGKTRVDDINTDGTTLFMTGYSVSANAPVFGEAYRATYDGSSFDTVGLGVLAGAGGTSTVQASEGLAVNASGVVAGTSDAARAVFEYDQSLVSAGSVTNVGVIFGISDDRVKVGISSVGTVWEADNTTRRAVTDPTGRGTGLYGISPDSSRLFGSSDVVDQVAGTVSEKLTWWTYDGTPTLVQDGEGNLIDGRFTDGTNSDIGYYVAVGESIDPGDLLHIEQTNETVRIEEWFEAISGQDLAALESFWGPELAYDYVNGVVAIVSGSHALVVKINNEPFAADDSYVMAENTTLEVTAPGVLGNDVWEDGQLEAVLVQGPTHGTIDLQADGSFIYTPKTNFNRIDSFQYRAADGAFDSQIATVTITLTTERPWHNGSLPLDVSDDGSISPRDALLGIDLLNRVGSHALPLVRDLPLSDPFYDTSRDGRLSPRDVLLVIDYLNHKTSSAQGEGEAVGASDSGSWAVAALVPMTEMSSESIVTTGAAAPIVATPVRSVLSLEYGVDRWASTVAARSAQDVWRRWDSSAWSEQLEPLLDDLVQ